MNNVSLTGRLTRDPEIRYTDGGTSIARFTLAVDRRYKQESGSSADFISCVAFGKTAEFIEKYFFKGVKMEVSGRIQTGSYTNQEGNKVYTTDVVAEQTGFAESRAASGQQGEVASRVTNAYLTTDGFINVPGDIVDEECPFS